MSTPRPSLATRTDEQSFYADIGDWSLLADTREVSITEQASGALPKQSITIPKWAFNHLVRHYSVAVSMVRKPI